MWYVCGSIMGTGHIQLFSTSTLISPPHCSLATFPKEYFRVRHIAHSFLAFLINNENKHLSVNFLIICFKTENPEKKSDVITVTKVSNS